MPPAHVHLAQFGGLPGDVAGVEQAAHIAVELGIGVAGTVFAAGAGVLGADGAVAQLGGVLLFVHFGKSGSKAASTSADRARVLSSTCETGMPGAQARARSSKQYCRKREAAPVAPSEPISSLSQNMTAMLGQRRLVFLALSRASRAVKTQMRSSWP